MLPAADEEGDELPVDHKLAAGEGPDVGVGGADVLTRAGLVRVHEALGVGAEIALVCRDVGECAGLRAECRAGRGPAFVRAGFEVVEDDLGSLIGGSCAADSVRAAEEREGRSLALLVAADHITGLRGSVRDGVTEGGDEFGGERCVAGVGDVVAEDRAGE